MINKYFTASACSAVFAMLIFAPGASATSVVDQSQLNFNLALVPSPDIGQSFQAGISGLLTDIDVFSNGLVQGGSNAITLELFSGNGTSGPLLGFLIEVVTSTLVNNRYLIDINSQSLNVNLKAGNEYTFDITNVTGPGDLAQRGLLADASNPYAYGQIYSSGTIPSWDLAFQTQVNPVSTPATLYLLAAGFFGMARCLGRKNAA